MKASKGAQGMAIGNGKINRVKRQTVFGQVIGLHKDTV